MFGAVEILWDATNEIMFLYFDLKGARNGALPPIERFDSSDAIQTSTKDRKKVQ